jgi:hypothetical protein
MPIIKNEKEMRVTMLEVAQQQLDKIEKYLKEE